MRFECKTKNGKDFSVRYPVKEDVEAMLRYINTLSQERTFIRYQGQVVTRDEEEVYLAALLKNIDEKKEVCLLAFCEGELIGATGIAMGELTESHEGILGLSVAKEFRGEGIGTILMRLILDEAIRHLPTLELVVLYIFSNNIVGKKLYERFGFTELGRLPNGVKLENGYMDRVIMYKSIV